MRVTAFGSTSLSTTRAPERPTDDGTFTGLVQGRKVASTSTSGTTTVTSLAGLSLLAALQPPDEVEERRQRLLRRGHGLLDQLEALQLGLLEGALPASLLRDLREQLAARDDHRAGDALAAVIDAIELRTAVELAKLESLAG